MKRIPLTQEQFALVDDEDYEELSQFKWFAQWSPNTRSDYAQRNIRLPDGKWTTEKMHRRILGLKCGDNRQGDHFNHATLDNRRLNIRIVTRSENMHNCRAKGYTWNNRDKKFQAKIRVDGVCTSLGAYDTSAEAHAAYMAAKRIYHPTAPKTML